MNCKTTLCLFFAFNCIFPVSSEGLKSAAQRKRFPKRSHSRDLAEARKFLSLPDLNALGESGGIPTHKAISTWASSIREAGQANSSPNCDFKHSEIKSKNTDGEANEILSHDTNANSFKNHRNRRNPWRRLMALPLWQTSLLSCKHVVVHSNDEVTYRERTFPTARYNEVISFT